VVLQRAAERNRLQRENLALRRMVAQRTPPVPMVGTSPAMRSVLETIGRIAGSDANVLIEGESGTGKGLAAQAIGHTARGGDQLPFVFRDRAGNVDFQNTFSYDRRADSWAWLMDNVQNGIKKLFARLTLTRH
jgi:transcriptional regulator of aromatic amino acid metabolism